VSVLNIEGDEQADLTDGGASKEAGAPAAQKTLDHVFARENHVSVADITRLYAFDRNDFAGRRGAAELKALPESWRSYFNEHVNKLTACG
jgi:3-alpha domain-containing YiiM-like protein